MSYDQEPNLKPGKGLDEKNTEDEKEEKENQEESFSFLQETVKPKPISREKIFNQLLRVAIYGVIFGAFSCCGFFALRPWAENTFQQDTEKVTIPEDEEQQNPEENTAESEVTLAVPDLDAESYEEMMQSLYGIAKEADKSVVSVRMSGESDWMGESSSASVTGLVAADNGREILILADNAVCKDATGWTVTFSDNSEYPASLVKQDKNTGLAVFGIEKSSITSSTWNSVQVAVLGNSNIVSRGDVVIALGNMFGYEGGLGYGVISSKEQDAIFSDGRCSVISTDIAVSSTGTGVLLDQSGEVLGLIKGNIWDGTVCNTANALAISDLKPVMELLLNGESVPYLGMHGTSVTEEISEQQEIPVGFYVTQVQVDSPAMEAGIQNGDVLQEVAGANVNSAASYKKAVLYCEVGETIKIKGQRRGAGGYVDVDFTVTVGSQE